MKTQISELMDGELDDETARTLFGTLKDAETSAEWHAYHLIGDAMRGTPPLSTDFMGQFTARLSNEPTVLAPRRAPKHSARMIALSAAASVTAVGLVVWAVLQTGSPHSSRPELIVAKAPEAMITNANMNPYLLAHQEYSPSVAMEGMAPYIRTVSEAPEVAAR